MIYSLILELIDDGSTSYLKKLPVSDYILGPGDTIKINVSRDYPELETIVKIGREGTIYLPKIKRVYIGGLTINELNLSLIHI